MIATIILIIILLLFLTVVILVSPASSTVEQRKPFTRGKIAHRGLHTKDKTVPENSLAAFKRACEHGYGIELDIQFSKDEQIVVFHDDTLLRVCGVDKRVDEYTYDELKTLFLCETAERIPLFSEVLAAIDGRVPLVVELKNGPKNRLLCEKSRDMLKKYKGEYCIESFQPSIVRWFRIHEPQVFRGQLSAGVKEVCKGPFDIPGFLLANCFVNCISRPHFLAYSKRKSSPFARLCSKLGAFNVVWTVRPEDDIKKITTENDAVIFEFYEP